MTDSSHVRRLEDRLDAHGLPTYCHVIEPDDGSLEGTEENLLGVPTLRVVIPLGTESIAFKLLRQERAWMLQEFGRDFESVVETILYYLAYRSFRRLAEPISGASVSTVIRNLQSPRKLPVRVREPHRKGNGHLFAFEYDVDIVGIAFPLLHPSYLADEVGTIADKFNSKSKYLRIGEVRVGFLPSKVGGNPIQFSIVRAKPRP